MEHNNKIKVFISSKCGGEKINFDNLVKATSSSKKDIANKAVRSNYDLVRRALRLQLEATDLISTYIFEDDDASTLPAQEDYFYELETSDICLFLIDNFDEEISTGLLAEITRAQKTNKKSIYLFLNDPNYEKTNIQNSLKGEKGIRYLEIDDIRKFIDEGYKSVINDILRIYQMYCRGNLNLVEDVVSPIEITKEKFSIETATIDKQVLKNLGLTKNKITNLVYEPDKNNVQSSDMDKLCLAVLEALLGEKTFKDIDLTSLLKALGEIQTPKLHEITTQRWKAIADFYNGNLDSSLSIMDAIYNKHFSSTDIPTWLIDDVLIDWRNFNIIKENINQIFDVSVQQKIHQRDSVIYFPVIDRFGANISNDLLDRNFEIFTSSPYSNTLYNINHLFDYISNYLFTAIYYGSFTHLFITLEQIERVLFDVVQKDNNLLNKIQLMKISVLRENEKDFVRIMAKYKAALSHSTPVETLDLYRLSEMKPLLHQKAVWKMLLFQELGYYFSDSDYATISDEILALSHYWIDEERFNTNLIRKAIDALKSNKDRLQQEKIIHFAIAIFDKKYYRFFGDLFDLLCSLNLSLVEKELISILFSRIKIMLEDEQVKQQDAKLKNLFLKIRKTRNEFSNEVDKLIEQHYPEYYKREYHLEIHAGERITHIQRYIDSIKFRNATQGKGGRYSIYTDYPYVTIKNIIQIDNISLPEELLNSLLKEILNTLLSETQNTSDKINSIQLLLCLREQQLAYFYDWNIYYSNIKQHTEEIQKGHSSLFEPESTLLLQLYLIILGMAFGDDSFQEFLEILALINNSSNRDIIDSLQALNEFLQVKKQTLEESSLTPVIVQYISAFCFHQDDNIRFHTVRLLYQLIESKYSSFVINRLAKMIDDDDFKVKWAIVNQVNLIKKHSLSTYNYIVGKTKIDKNYIVRKRLEVILYKENDQIETSKN